MRKVFLLAAIVVACAKKEAPPADTAAPAPPPPPPPPPALTAADVKGTWNGTSKRENDTTAVKWTVVSTSDSTAKLTFAGSKESVALTTKFDADSMISTSAAYKDPGMPKNAPKVMFKSVAHLKDGKLTGNSTIMLASKPDSVVGKGSWEATKAP